MSSKKTVELLGSSYKGTTILANTVVVLSKSRWGKSVPERTSELSLERQVKSKGSAGRVDWKVSLIPENENQPL